MVIHYVLFVQIKSDLRFENPFVCFMAIWPLVSISCHWTFDYNKLIFTHDIIMANHITSSTTTIDYMPNICFRYECMATMIMIMMMMMTR